MGTSVWNRLALPFVAVWMLLCSPAGPCSADPPKKLIEFGWDEPTTAYLREHCAEMEQMPFDGVVFSIHYRIGTGRDNTLEWTGFGTTAIPWEALAPALADIQATRFHRFTDNFPRFNTAPANVDWFDDFSAIVHNAKMVARFCKQGRLKGILFDTEAYQGPLFEYPRQKYRDQYTFDEYAAQVRQRGEEIMRAFQEEAPGLTLFLTIGYDVAGSRREDLLKGRYGLFAAFLDGLYAAARGRTRIVDGFESSYRYRTPEQFEKAYETMRKGNLAVCSVPKPYLQRMTAGFGLWMDPDWRKAGWRTDDVDANPVPPAQLETALTAALRRADRYVWLYTEQPRWWPREKLPDAYIDAVRRARANAGLPGERNAGARTSGSNGAGNPCGAETNLGATPR